MSGKPMLSTQDLAARWGVTVSRLANWRYERRGPAYLKIEGTVRYRLVDVERYEESQLVGTPT